MSSGKWGKGVAKAFETDAGKEAKNLANQGGSNKPSGAGDAAASAVSKMDWKDGGSKMSLPGLDWLKSLTGGSSSDPHQADPGGPAMLGKLASPPSIGLPVSGSAGGGLALFQILLILGVAALVIVLVWRLLARMGSRDVQAELRRTVWPMPPGQVCTRQQLIQAFEHLALVVLGPGARTTNHRAIADGLGATPQRTQAAEELATLYEWARYNPALGEMPGPDLAAARRDLCFLAGMAAS
jgi:hypothetical protein